MTLKGDDDKGGIVRCPNCTRQMIAEEAGQHGCFVPRDIWVIDGVVWIGDGKRYFKKVPSSDSIVRNPKSIIHNEAPSEITPNEAPRAVTPLTKQNRLAYRASRVGPCALR